MPAETSIGLSQETKDRLEDRRAPGHASMEDVIAGLLEIVPPVDEILDEEACSWRGCDHNIWNPSTPEKKGGVIRYFHTEHDDADIFGSNYFCSIECAAKVAEETEKMAATHPDKFIIGGMDEMRFEVTNDDLRLFHRDDGQELSIPAPLDLVGETKYHEFDYHGEPIYVWNAGKTRFAGVIGEIIREETHTAINLGRDHTAEQLNHPNDEKRQSFIETYSHWYEQECPECGEELRVNEDMDDEIECGECGSMVEREPVPEHEIPAEVREFRDEFPDS